MPESVLAPTFSGFLRLPSGNFPFTMVPNQFLDEVVPNEKPCVVKVVCLILRRTLGWVDEKGQRRQQEQVAYTEFAREMKMSIQAVADGVRIALEKGYIVRTKQGSSLTGEGAWYSLRWSETSVSAEEEKTESKKQSRIESKKQILPTLKNRDMIKKPESESKKVEINASSNFKISELANRSEPTKKFSTYIGNLITEIGQQFGETENHRLPNIKHALNLWDEKNLSEAEFAKLVYQARDLTRTHASAYSGSATPQNRMPYFFRVLQNLVAENNPFTEETTLTNSEAEQISQNPTSNENKEPSSISPTNSFLSSLALTYSTQPTKILEKWEQVISQAEATPLAAITKRSLGLESSLASADLLNCMGLTENQIRTQIDIIIIFRNSFDAHLASNSYLDLQNLLEKVWAKKVVLHLTHL